MIVAPVCPTVVSDCQPPSQRGPAGCVSVLPALLPVAAGSRAACGPVGGLEGSLPPAEGRSREGSDGALHTPTGPPLPAHRGDRKEMTLSILSI